MGLPFLPSSLGEKPQDFAVEGFHVGQGLHLHLQQVILAKFALQVLDRTDTSGGRKKRRESIKKWEREIYCWWLLASGGQGRARESRSSQPLLPLTGECPLCRACLGTLGGHSPQPPGHHDGHTVTHGLRLCHVMGSQEGASLRVSKSGPDGLPNVRAREMFTRGNAKVI